MKKFLYLLIVLLSLLPATAYAGDSRVLKQGFDITLSISKKSVSLLTDGKINTYIVLPEDENINIRCKDASAIMLKWYEETIYDVSFSGSDNLNTRSVLYDNGILNQYIFLNGANGADIHLPRGGKLSDIIFYSEGEPAIDTQIWEPPYEKADVLVISAHPDDEYLFMGGTIPYYGKERGLRVTVVWMSHQNRLRQEEALSAFWAMGDNHYPEFAGFPDKFSNTYEGGVKIWGEQETLSKIVEKFRRYKPEVVVTHDLKGEYGHGAHMLTAAMALKAASYAADAARFPESADKYGVWQIKKLYLHLYNENKIVMAWDQPLEAFGGKTGLEMAKIGYSFHKSQHIYNLRVSSTSKNACTRFGLAFTAVGFDVKKNDFLENVPAELLSNYISPAPPPATEVTEAPEPSASESAPDCSDEPLRSPSSSPSADIIPSSAEKTGSDFLPAVIALSGLLLVITVVVIIRYLLKARR